MIKGYKIFDNLEQFYNWQGKNGNPDEGTVNYILGYSTSDENNTYRYTYPRPHNSAFYSFDEYGMPVNINGPDLRVCCLIDDECPVDLIPENLMTLEEVQNEGFFVDSNYL